MKLALDDYAWAAGVATDLVLTAPAVWHGVDQLPTVGALSGFLDEHDLADVPARGLPSVHHLRGRLRALIDDPRARALVAGAGELTASCGGLTLGADESGRVDWYASTARGSDPAAQLALVCGLGILGVVRALGAERFRACRAPNCSGAFIDTSRPGRRRYCMPELCGNRVNVANYRARVRERGRTGG